MNRNYLAVHSDAFLSPSHLASRLKILGPIGKVTYATRFRMVGPWGLRPIRNAPGRRRRLHDQTHRRSTGFAPRWALDRRTERGLRP
jgi:hypothetical protein